MSEKDWEDWPDKAPMDEALETIEELKRQLAAAEAKQDDWEFVAETATNKINEMSKDADRLAQAVEEAVRAISCSPKKPWEKCKKQSQSNSKHYESHAGEVETILREALAAHKENTPPESA